MNSSISDAFYALKRDNWCGNWDTSGAAWYTCGLPCLSTQVEQEDILIRMFKDQFSIAARLTGLSSSGVLGKDYTKTVTLNRDINDTDIYDLSVTYKDRNMLCRIFNVTVSIPKSNLEHWAFEDRKTESYTPYQYHIEETLSANQLIHRQSLLKSYKKRFKMFRQNLDRGKTGKGAIESFTFEDQSENTLRREIEQRTEDFDESEFVRKAKSAIKTEKGKVLAEGQELAQQFT